MNWDNYLSKEAIETAVPSGSPPRQCECETLVVKRRSIRGGAVQYVNQCTVCGSQKGSAIKKNEIDASAVPVFNEDIKEEHSRKWREHHARNGLSLRDRRDKEWWRRYNEYLTSEEWATKRTGVFSRKPNGKCEGCDDRAATQVHHTTYQHVGNEFLWELVIVCEKCHARVHRHRTT